MDFKLEWNNSLLFFFRIDRFSGKKRSKKNDTLIGIVIYTSIRRRILPVVYLESEILTEWQVERKRGCNIFRSSSRDHGSRVHARSNN